MSGRPREVAPPPVVSNWNLPNFITATRIAIAPLIAFLPFVDSPTWRAVAFGLYVAAAISDYVDGVLARTRGLITDLGKSLDPLADKLLLVATSVTLLVLQSPPGDPVVTLMGRIPGIVTHAHLFPFISFFGTWYLPWWVIAVVLGREAFMTAFRAFAQRRGVVIAAIGPAKWKAAMQYIWVGAAFCHFAVITFARHELVHGQAWVWITQFVGSVGVVSMLIAVALTLWSLVLYMRRYGALFTQ
ncbi:MAG: CDP-alcohol phosphatidyltransferase family protein [bacterium]